MPALYNEIEKFPAAWTRNLIDRGLVAPGTVDERSVADIQPTDLVGVEQFHTFSGIAIWSYALRRAGVPDSANVWTGSCPCQPFSDAGAKAGFADERHLWPEWFRLIRECRPAIVFGEQVASPLGRAWLDAVFADLESIGYACGADIIPAASVGAPHQRHRIYFVAYTREAGRGERSTAWLHEDWKPRHDADGCSATDAVADAGSLGRGQGREHLLARRQQPEQPRSGADDLVGDATRARREDTAIDGIAPRADGEIETAQGRRGAGLLEPERASAARDDSALVDAGSDGDRQHPGELPGDEGEHDLGPAHGDHPSVPAGATRGYWSDAKWVWCRDGKWRPISPQRSSFPMADVNPGRVGRLRAFGNAIVAEVAIAFIESALEAISDIDVADLAAGNRICDK